MSSNSTSQRKTSTSRPQAATTIPPLQQPRQQLPVDSSLSNFFYMLILNILKKFVFTPTHIKIGIYFIALLLCSLLKDFQRVPQTYFSFKSNFFNLYFVKIAWGWTLFLTIPFVFMTSSVYTGGNALHIRKHLTRIGVATILWYSWTSVFQYFDHRTGMCTNRTHVTKQACKATKNEWVNSFDISGHTFILMHSLFFMLEEVKVFYKWENIKQKLLNTELSESTNGGVGTSDLSRIKKFYTIFTPFIKINFILIALFTLLWEVMLLSTFLYFHTILHKLIAAFVAVGCWFLTYNVYYQSDDYFLSPGLPGVGII